MARPLVYILTSMFHNFSFSVSRSRTKDIIRSHAPFEMIVSLILIAVVVSLIYAFFAWNNGHWQKLGIPHIPPTFFFGNTPSMMLQKRNAYYDIQDIYK